MRRERKKERRRERRKGKKEDIEEMNWKGEKRREEKRREEKRKIEVSSPLFDRRKIQFTSFKGNLTKIAL